MKRLAAFCRNNPFTLGVVESFVLLATITIGYWLWAQQRDNMVALAWLSIASGFGLMGALFQTAAYLIERKNRRL